MRQRDGRSSGCAIDRRTMSSADVERAPSAAAAATTYELQPGRLIRIACVSVVLCIVVTFACATTESVIYSDVFPVISETFVTEPGSYIAEFCLGFSAWVLFAMVWVVRAYLETYASYKGDAWARHARRSAYVGYVGAVCIALTAAINMWESFVAHIIAAFTFMFAQSIWIACVLAQLRAHPDAVSTVSYRAKCCALVGATIGVLIFTVLSSAVKREDAYSFIGAGEWLAVFSIIFFAYTIAWDFEAKKVAVVLRVPES